MTQRFGKNDRGFRYENDMEAADEFSPDPFSEEPHTILHKKRMKSGDMPQKKQNNPKNKPPF